MADLNTNNSSSDLNDLSTQLNPYKLEPNISPKGNNQLLRGKDSKEVWHIVKTASSIIFENIDIGNCIYKAFLDNNWINIDDILDNLIQHNDNNYITIISKYIKNNSKITNKWDEKRNNNVLYRLLLTIYKDKEINIANLWSKFAVISPQQSKITVFKDCNIKQMIAILCNKMYDFEYINKIIQYFLENEINGQIFCDIEQPHFVNNLSVYILNQNDNNGLRQEISKLFTMFESYKNSQIWRCQICGNINIINEETNTRPKCGDCHSIFEIECKSNEEIGTDIKYNELHDAENNNKDHDLSQAVMEFFNLRSGMEFEEKVFISLTKLFENNVNGLMKMRYDNYSIDLEKKDYDTILKSFIAWIVTLKCENKDCHNKSKLICSCDPNQLPLFTYSVILSIIGLKSANNDSLLKKLYAENRSIDKISNEFLDILSDELKSKNYKKTYKKYISQWVSFELYNFKCIECTHINKSILINRMYEYPINLNYCRLCHHKRSTMNHSVVVDLDVAIKNKQKCHENEMEIRIMNIDTGPVGVLYTKYKNGVAMRYTVLRPKYGSLAEEIMLNDVASLTKESWQTFLNEAKKLHLQLQQQSDTNTSIDGDTRFGIEPNELIGVCHLIVVLIYTENIHFAREFSRCYWDWMDENLFCNNFYWFGRYLYEAVYYFGQRFDHNRFKIKHLHHGLASLMEFNSFSPTIHFPAATNDNKLVITKAGNNGTILTYIPKYMGNIDNTKCVSTAQWSGYDNYEWLFMGSSKLQICSIKSNENGEDFTKYCHAMLYLEKILTQTVYDQNHYNTMNNMLYLPEIREIALRLILNRMVKDIYDELPKYIENIFARWCKQRKFISFETYLSESRFMNSRLREFFFDEVDTLNVANLKMLFPHLKKYRDIDGKVRFIDPSHNYSPSYDNPKVARSISREDAAQIKEYVKDEKLLIGTSWECANCGYNNIPLMINGLWRYYNRMSSCGLCGKHQYLHVNNAFDEDESGTNIKLDIEEKLEILKTEKEYKDNGFVDDAQCLIGKSHISKLNVKQLICLLQQHVIQKIKNDTHKRLITEYKDKIISYFESNNIDGKKFSGYSGKELRNAIIAHCDQNKKLNAALGAFLKCLRDFDLKKLNGSDQKAENDDKKQDDEKQQILWQEMHNHCPSMIRIKFIVQYFEQLTSKLPKGGKYPYDMRRFLLSFPDYGPIALLNDIEHVIGHDPRDGFGMECKQNEKCVHFTRSKRDENEKKYRDIDTKRKLFNCDNANDFVYIDMLDRLHTTLKHSKDINHNRDRDIKIIQNDVKSTKTKFDKGVFMEYHSLKPLYMNLKREITHNKAYSITLQQFESQLNAVKDFMKTNSEILKWKACKTDNKYGIKKGDPIRVEHILSIMLYSNFTDLCTAFRESYRKIDYEDINDIIIARHIDNFYWFGRFLTNAIDFYGKTANKDDIIYTGISCKCLFDQFSAVYETPTSTTWNFTIAAQFTKETGIILQLSPKFKDEMNVSRYIDVSKISITNFKEEKERLFAGMSIMSITNIFYQENCEWKNYGEYIQTMLYFERIIEQTIQTKKQYNHSIINEAEKEITEWKHRQKKYLVPLIEHQMMRNLTEYNDHLKDIGFHPNKQNENMIPKYICELFENFCDNKNRNFIDLSCIRSEIKNMDQSLSELIFIPNTLTTTNKEEINDIYIAAIFPNVKQFKHPNGEWKRLKSLKDTFIQYKQMKQLNANNMNPIKESALERNHQIGMQIDSALSRYYFGLDRKDYYDINRIGKFNQYCIENGFDEGGIEDELGDPKDCMLVEFDEDFPFNTAVTDDKERDQMIFDVIMKCKENKDAFKPKYPFKSNQQYIWSISKGFFAVSDKYRQDIEAMYKKQCKSMWKSGLNQDKALMKLISIGHKNDLPYLQYLVDIFMRDKISYKLDRKNNGKILQIREWSQTNAYMKKVKQNSSENYDMITHALSSFCSRMIPTVSFCVDHTINDDLYDIARYIVAANQMVIHWIFNKGGDGKQPPWQMDFSIIFRNVCKQNYSLSLQSDHDDEDDDDIDTDPGNTNNEAFDDCIGDIVKGLKDSKLIHHSFRLSCKDNNNQRNGSKDIVRKCSISRAMKQGFYNFAKKKDADPHSNYPQYERFCAVLDRRSPSKKSDNKLMFDDNQPQDQMHFFAPTKCNKMTKKHVTEWYLESSKTYLFPHCTNDESKIITSREAVNGSLMTFSFHVESSNNIKCYLYYNGGMMRFFPQDIIDVLPDFFEKKYKSEEVGLNEKFFKSSAAKLLVDKMKLYDTKFESFREYATRK